MTLDLERLRERTERAEAKIVRLKGQLTRVIGSIQRLQPKGSPPPGGPEILAEWIVFSTMEQHREQLAALETLRGMRERVDNAIGCHGGMKPHTNLGCVCEPCNALRAVLSALSAAKGEEAGR